MTPASAEIVELFGVSCGEPDQCEAVGDYFSTDGTQQALMDLYRFTKLEGTEDKKESHDAWRERRKPEIKDK